MITNGSRSVDGLVGTLRGDKSWQGDLSEDEISKTLKWADQRLTQALEQAMIEVQGRLRTANYLVLGCRGKPLRSDVLQHWLY